MHDQKRQVLATKQAELQRLIQTIENQKYSPLHMKALSTEENSLKNALTMLESEKNKIQTEAAETQVKLARYHKQKLDAIKKFNNFTFHTTKKLMQIPSIQINVNDFTIDPTDTNEKIHTVCSRLRQLNDNCAIVKRQHIEQIQQNKAKLIEYKTMYNQLFERQTEQLSNVQKADSRLTALKQECSDYESKGSTCTIKLKQEISEKIAEEHRIDAEINAAKAKILELEAKNKELFEDGERKAQEIIRTKQLLCMELDKLNDFIDDETDKI